MVYHPTVPVEFFDVADPLRMAQQWLHACHVFVATSETQLSRARLQLQKAEQRVMDLTTEEQRTEMSR